MATLLYNARCTLQGFNICLYTYSKDGALNTYFSKKHLSYKKKSERQYIFTLLLLLLFDVKYCPC